MVEIRGPRKGSLTQLIEWLQLEPILKSTMDLHRVRRFDRKNIFATVEDGHLVFIVRGTDAVRQIFPTIPSRVTFRATIETSKTHQHKWGNGSLHDYKTVVVNDPNSPDLPEMRRPKCDNIGDDWDS